MVVDWGADHARPDLALRQIAPLMGHGHAAGYSATEWADTAVDIPGAEDYPEFLAVASWAVFGAAMRQDFERATDIAGRIERIQAETGRTDAGAYWGLGTLAFFQGDVPSARRLSEAWVAAAQAADDGYQLAHALVLHAATDQIVGLPTARADMEDAMRVARDTGTLSALSLALSSLVGMLDLDTERDLALALTEEAIAVAADVGDHVAITVAESTRAAVLALRGDYGAALMLVRAAADDLLRFNSGLAVVPLAFAAFMTVLGFDDRRSATVLLGKARESSAGNPGLWMEQHIDAIEAVLRAELADEFQPAYERGAAMSAIEAARFITELEYDTATMT
jgi:hypothetical protein